MRVWSPLGLWLAACGTGPTTPPDPCIATEPTVASGVAELGLGSDFSAMYDGQNVSLQLGIQGFEMFVMNARVHDMDVGAGSLAGVVDFTARDEAGKTISSVVGCRVLEFTPQADGSMQLDAPFQLVMDQSLTSTIDGTIVTVRLDVRDHDHHLATDERTVIARLPSSHRFDRPTLTGPSKP